MEEDKTTKRKKISLVAGAVMILPTVLLFAYIIWSSVFTHFKTYEPTVTYGEFPCRLTYEVNGDKKVLEDVIICEYDKSRMEITEQKRDWKSYLKSGERDLVLLDLRGKGVTDEYGREITKLFFDYGNAAYYMGDEENSPFEPQPLGDVAYVVETQLTKTSSDLSMRWYTAEEAFEKYGVKIISFEHAEPIENEFK